MKNAISFENKEIFDCSRRLIYCCFFLANLSILSGKVFAASATWSGVPLSTSYNSGLNWSTLPCLVE